MVIAVIKDYHSRSSHCHSRENGNPVNITVIIIITAIKIITIIKDIAVIKIIAVVIIIYKNKKTPDIIGSLVFLFY
jgi:hypothetical protein